MVGRIHQRLRPWWRRHEGADGPTMLAAARRDAPAIRERCDRFDDPLRAEAAGGPGYADLLALTFRQAVAAHKRVSGPNGVPLFLSKEKFSNGCIATVDVTYPSAPLFLRFNPALLKAMLDPVIAYCASPDWTPPSR